MIGDFRLVDAAEHWPSIAARLEGRADEALQECVEGRALCFVGSWGTFVIGLYPGQNGDQLEAYVLLALAEQHGAFEASEPAVLTVARDLKATTVAFHSVRRGWARRLGPPWRSRGKDEFWRYVDEQVEEPSSGNPAAAGAR